MLIDIIHIVAYQFFYRVLIERRRRVWIHLKRELGPGEVK